MAAAHKIVHSDQLDWQPSPVASVWRKRLELAGPAESGRVTSIVRYDAGAVFPSHPHPEGEEIFVLDGVFSDEHGDYPAGTFLLNPEGFEHAPFSRGGCTLFVKLRQSPGSRRHIRMDTASGAWQATATAGVSRMALYADPGFPETVHLTRVSAGVAVGPIAFPTGEELLVLAGSFEDEHGSYQRGSWLRFSPGSSHSFATRDGCTLYVKQGHLCESRSD